LSLLAALVLALAMPVAASAATTHAATTASSHLKIGTTVIPDSAVGCSGDACIYLATPSGGKVTIHGCAWKSAFTGYIQISGPAGQLPKYSATKRWASTSHYCTGGDQYYSVTVTAVVGQYCSTSWAGGNYNGTACESVE
jgi:hypothetical protein